MRSMLKCITLTSLSLMVITLQATPKAPEAPEIKLLKETEAAYQDFNKAWSGLKLYGVARLASLVGGAALFDEGASGFFKIFAFRDFRPSTVSAAKALIVSTYPIGRITAVGGLAYCGYNLYQGLNRVNAPQTSGKVAPTYLEHEDNKAD